MTPGSDSLEYPVRQLLYCAAGQAAYTWVWRRETQRQGTGACGGSCCSTGFFKPDAFVWTPNGDELTRPKGVL
jgi:hypothetical protein